MESSASVASRPASPRIDDPTTWITPAVRAVLLDRAALECLTLGARTIAIYGAGRHTRAIGFGAFESRGLRVTAILDDDPPETALHGVPVMRPEDAPIGAFDAVVVSSDRHEGAMLKRIRDALVVTGPPVVPIYAPLLAADSEQAAQHGASIDIVGPLAQRAARVSGDMAEMGVFDGRTFGGLLQVARRHGRQCHAFDTFHGMPEPGEQDPRRANGEAAHPKGQFDIGGAERFVWNGAEGAVLWPGLIPDSFDGVPSCQTFCFVRLDLDNYDPTLAAARWVWPRMPIGACLTCHDYYPENGLGAAGALDAFLSEVGHDLDGVTGREAWVFKRRH